MLRLAVITGLSITLAGCGAAVVWVAEALTPGVEAEKIEIHGHSGANNNSPVRVDVVLIYDKALVKQFVELPASEWFAQRAQFKRDFPESMGILEFEIVPGTQVEHELSVVDRYRAQSGLVFVDYPSKGSHRVRIDGLKSVHVHLLAHDFELGS